MEQQDRIMDGDLQTLGLQSILKMLALSGKTGKLLVSSGPEMLSINLRKGQIVSLREDGGVPQADLLAMLCLIGKLDLSRIQSIRELAQGDPYIALAMLVERGWMSANEMQRRLEFITTQSISHALRWVNGRFAFHRILPIDGLMQPLDVDSVLLEALRQADEWEEIANEGVIHLARTTAVRWLPEVSNDVRSLGLSQDAIEVLCLSNGEIPLQSVAQVLMMPEARIARTMARLLDLHLIEVVDTALETELQQDLANVIVKCQHFLAFKRQSSSPSPEQHLLGLIAALSECINGLLAHHSVYAKGFRGRGQVPPADVARYLERRFEPQLQLLSSRRFPILDTASFEHGRLNTEDIRTLNKVVKGEQLEEFYWEAVQGLSAFLRMVFDSLLKDEVGNSHTGRQLNMVWKVFLTEIDHEIQQYQIYRAHRTAQATRGSHNGREHQPPQMGLVPNQGEYGRSVKETYEHEGNSSQTFDKRRRFM